MPQGPAANCVRIGDKITSITIDLRHMVQEDAATILSYASPYNVQLELIDGNGVLTYAPPANSPKSASGQRSLTHPLYRSSSQEDFNTIERNARRKYPSGSTDDGGNYPTLKMEQKNQLPVVHRENEKKPVVKVVDETKQNRASATESITKFGVRVLPPTVTAISTVKGQADNENNTNKEVEVDVVVAAAAKRLSPPPISKRTKHMKVDESKVATIETESSEFERQRSITSSGIRRDAAGIPQEIPNQMMAAAMAARENRKSSVDTNDSKRNKGKAPQRPLIGDLNDSIDTEVTNISLNSVDSVDSVMKAHNFTDNFDPSSSTVADDHLHTPPMGRKVQHSSDTESQLAAYDQGELTAA